MELDIVAILRDLVVAAIVWALMDRERKVILDRIARLENDVKAAEGRYDKMLSDSQIRYEKLQEKYLVDLAGGVAVNVRYTRNYQNPEDDTQVRTRSKTVTPNLTDDEYQVGLKKFNE